MTLSLKNWMELPGMNIREFDTGKQQKCNLTPQSNKCKHSKHVNENNNNLFTSETFSEASQFRATAKEIKAYYEKYAERNNLDKYLLNSATVTAVKKFACCSCANDLNELWEVCGYCENANGKRIEFKFICKYLVLATGVSDMPNELSVCGEHYNFVLKSQKDLEEKIRKDVNKLRKDPIVIVGCGLNAAECILLAQQHKIKVIHVVRRSVYDQSIIFSRLSKSIYPEYHHVYDKMVRRKQYDDTKVKRMNNSDEDMFVNSDDELTNSSNEQHEYYQLFDEHEVKCFTSRRTCIIRDLKRASAVKVLNNSDGDISHAEELLNEGETEFKMSYACVLIGNLPNFGFFPPAMRTNIGIKKTKPVNGKDNPVNVDPFTLESNEYKNLFAMGPLVGDNFVRFAIGGALAITNTLIKNRTA